MKGPTSARFPQSDLTQNDSLRAAAVAFILRSDFARGLRLPERAHEVMLAGEKDWGKKREDASHVELHETYYEPHSRINHSVARSGQHRVHMDQAFLPGDVWRGHLTSCHQTALHARRRFRYVAVEPTVLPPGRYVITNQTYGTTPGDYYWQVPIELAPGVEWLEGRHRGGAAMIFPDTTMSSDTSAALWFGPNLLFND